ncbi:MAG: hypothetical protein NTZ42_03435 [Candidatus Gribaldobacteria bacterium]|nr:hypothetical protein [Candidatus Gribaldobacteria bacterium]
MSIINKEEVNEILQKKGEIRGVAFQSIGDFILKKKGQTGLLEVEKQMAEWGADFYFSGISPMAWYPIAWGALSILAAQEVFGWTEQDIREMGANAPKASVVVKLMFKLFSNMKQLSKQIPGFWRKNYTVGEVEVMNLDEDKKEMVLHFKDSSFHPSLCKYVEGFAETTLQFSRPKNSVISVKETKCSFKDNVPYEEYIVRWT